MRPMSGRHAAGGFKITTLGRGGFASRVLRVRDERRTALTASLRCWHAYPVGVSAVLTLAPGSSPWRLQSALAVPRPTSRTVTAGPGCGAREPPFGAAANQASVVATGVHIGTIWRRPMVKVAGPCTPCRWCRGRSGWPGHLHASARPRSAGDDLADLDGGHCGRVGIRARAHRVQRRSPAAAARLQRGDHRVWTWRSGSPSPIISSRPTRGRGTRWAWPATVSVRCFLAAAGSGERAALLREPRPSARPGTSRPPRCRRRRRPRWPHRTPTGRPPRWRPRRRSGSKTISTASAWPGWFPSVGLAFWPPVYPTRVEMTPSRLRSSSWTPQKHPPARIAVSVASVTGALLPSWDEVPCSAYRAPKNAAMSGTRMSFQGTSPKVRQTVACRIAPV